MNSMRFTIKNYKQEMGMSKKFFAGMQTPYSYLISGPYGKGLGIENSGVHIAFAAGTGVLTFMDTVALIAKRFISFDKSCCINKGVNLSDATLDASLSFSLILYVSF